jgi:hypothetical protein
MCCKCQPGLSPRQPSTLQGSRTGVTEIELLGNPGVSRCLAMGGVDAFPWVDVEVKSTRERQTYRACVGLVEQQAFYCP